MNMPELLPCPYCGKEANIGKTDFGFYFVGCSTKDCYGSILRMSPISQNIEEIIQAWNRRMTDV